jgi:hypothetical protein
LPRARFSFGRNVSASASTAVSGFELSDLARRWIK